VEGHERRRRDIASACVGGDLVDGSASGTPGDSPLDRPDVVFTERRCPRTLRAPTRSRASSPQIGLAMGVDQLELAIIGSGDEAQATAVARCGHDFAIETLPCDVLSRLQDFRAILAGAALGSKKTPSPNELMTFGHSLFDFTVRGTIKTVYDRLPASHIRLQIYSNRPDLQALPWEYMQDRSTAPGPNSLRSVIRVVPTIGVNPPDKADLRKSPRMLFVYADPVGQAGVDWPAIHATITREFTGRLPAGFHIELVPAATRQALFDALDGQRYDILHFAGHGEVAPDGSGHLLLRDFKSGKTDPVSSSDLGILLRNKALRLVVLSACNTSAGDFAREFAIVSRTLIQCGVPAVVANQFPVTNSVAATFSGAFYNELLRTGDVDLAVANGRLQLAIQPPKGTAARIEWGIPTLYRHVGAAQVFAT
jgi:hypothetical protein